MNTNDKLVKTASVLIIGSVALPIVVGIGYKVYSGVAKLVMNRKLRKLEKELEEEA